MKPYHVYLLIAFALVSPYLLTVARADQAFLGQVVDRQATRTCAFNAMHAKTVALSSTSAASAALAQGNLRIVCTQDAHFYQGAAGVTGPTAGTGDTFIAAKSPEYVYSPNATSKIAFLRDSADGTCFVTECQ